MKTKTVWLVGSSDCEGATVTGVYASRSGAMKGWNILRRSLLDTCRAAVRRKDSLTSLYAPQIKALQCTDPEKIDNYPHDTPWLREYCVQP